MTDGKLAVIGLGTIGSMALWQASRLSDSVVGFEAQLPAHGRSAVGGDTRLFRMLNLNPGFYPILQRSQRLWAELEEESGQDILLRCGGLYIGTENGPYIPQLLESARATGAAHEILSREEMAERYPQHNLRPDDIGCVRSQRRRAANGSGRHGCDVRGPGQRRDRAQQHPSRRDPAKPQDGVVVTSGEKSWTFENVIVASGGWSQKLMPESLQAHTQPNRVFLTWFVAKDPALFSPERFPIFVRLSGDRSMYGAPAVDGVTVKATLNFRPTPTENPDAVPRELTRGRDRRDDRDGERVLPGPVSEHRPVGRVPGPLHDRPQSAARPAGSRAAGSTARPGSPAAASKWPPGTARSPPAKRSACRRSKAWTSCVRNDS